MKRLRSNHMSVHDQFLRDRQPTTQLITQPNGGTFAIGIAEKAWRNVLSQKRFTNATSCIMVVELIEKDYLFD